MPGGAAALQTAGQPVLPAGQVLDLHRVTESKSARQPADYLSMGDRVAAVINHTDGSGQRCR
jgi:hypothetical protein